MTLPSLRLKANAERRLRAGHLWVYSNEVDVAATPLNGFGAGEQAVLEMANGKPLGIVAMSPNNLICARLISRDTKHVLDKSLLVHRLNVALSLRERLFDKPFYRLAYGDSDLLPGGGPFRRRTGGPARLGNHGEAPRRRARRPPAGTQAQRRAVEERLQRP